MKKPALLFSLKCGVILYFAACTNIDRLTVARTVSQSVITGSWKIAGYSSADQDNSRTFSGYNISFNDGGKFIIHKNGNVVQGDWYEDNASKTLLLNVETDDKVLQQLNANWNINGITDNSIVFKSNDQHNESLCIIKE